MNKGTSEATYGLGVVDAVIYFIQRATTFWGGALGILKVMVWPAILALLSLYFTL